MRDVDEGCALVAASAARRSTGEAARRSRGRRAAEGAAPDDVARSVPLADPDSSASSASASARPSTNGSFSIASAWAGTFALVRRP